MLTDKAVLEQPRLTQSVRQVWLYRMIDAGWEFTFGEVCMFRHADEYKAQIALDEAWFLCILFWKTLEIPTPYNYRELAGRMHHGAR